MTDIHDPCRAAMEKADRALRAALDEIERLTQQNTDLRRWQALEKPLTAAMSIVVTDMQELRAEIERLTALAQSNDDITWELTGENERLRAALRFYAEDCAETGLIARRALEPKP